MIEDNLKFEIKDSLFDPEKSGQEAFKRTSGSRDLYKVWIYLDGRDIGLIEHVKYRLHPSFKNPVKMVKRKSANSLFKLPIWTWGLFNVHAEVKTIDGRRYNLNHKLEYHRQIPQAKFVEG